MKAFLRDERRSSRARVSEADLRLWAVAICLDAAPPDKELHVIAETGKGHAAGCFLDGIMASTGCTYGKANIEKTHWNKMAFTLIEGGCHAAAVEVRDPNRSALPRGHLEDPRHRQSSTPTSGRRSRT
ncbi:MAG: formylmethanofuran dehydrogenase subunit E family protein [Deltaproteobacteria bacterium]|nr:formylmethanofuran dehydrogenase subunit E family protein [Deltaproteobacteria bacterium]